MRILHVVRVSGIAGAENHLLTLLPALRRAGVDAEVALLTAPSGGHEAFAGGLAQRGVPHRVVSTPSTASPGSFARVRKAVAGFDVVHTHLTYADAVAGAAARAAGVPLVVSTRHGHARYPPTPTRRAIARWTARAAHRLVAISHHLREDLGACGVDGRKVSVVHYGLDASSPVPAGVAASVRAGFGAAGGAPLLACVARLDPIKGHRFLFEAFARLRKEFPDARLVLVGDGPLRDALRTEARLVGVADATVFAGFRRDVDACMAASDVVVLPSLAEGFGLVLLEAAAQERAVVASRAGAMPEIVVDGETGRLAAPGDAEALADALRDVLAHAARRRAMGLAGRKRLAASFSVERMVEGTMAIYEGGA